MAAKKLTATSGEPVEEHKVPPTTDKDRQHELNDECWCKPTVIKLWEGTDHERHVYQHYTPQRKKARAPRKRST